MTNNNRSENQGKSVMASMIPPAKQNMAEIQPYNVVIHVPLALEQKTRELNVVNLNQLLADTMTLRDLYKKQDRKSVV